MQSLALDAPSHGAPSWEALDERAEWEAFSRPLAGDTGQWESYLAIGGMHCAACALSVEAALQAMAGVREVQVNGASASARVVWSPAQGRPSDWMHALRRAGYQGLPAGDLLAAAPRRAASRRALWRWLVAGFCMMQVMMYAAPAYWSAPGDISAEAQGLLRWASWILTLPVVLFSCSPFFGGAWRDLRHGRVGMDVPVALGIAIAFAASTAATFAPAGPLGTEVWFDSVTMFVFFLLSGRMLEQRLRDRTAGALEALVRRLPDTVERRDRDGRFERVAVRRLAIGDLVRVLPGEAFPADGTVVTGESQVDEALLTGESTPLPRGPGEAVIAGSFNRDASLLVRVESCGADTRYAGIVALMERASVDKPALALLADRIAGPFVLLVLLAAAGAAWWWWEQGPAHAIGVAVAVLIVTCPCALSLATPAATLAAAGALARRGVLVRRLQALETGAAIDTVVFDKTGTLTQEQMAVTTSRVRPGAMSAQQALQLAAALARHSLHPVARALAAQPGALQTEGVDVVAVREHPGQGVEGVAIDAAGRQWPLRLGSAGFCGALAGEGEGARVHLADAAGWLASFEMEESLRAGAVAAVAALGRQGLRVELLSGDRPEAVKRLASRVGILLALGAQTPQNKLDHLAGLQSTGRRVAMVGDGMNDGPVLARADLAIAMGVGVPLAQAGADAVVQGGRLDGVALLLLQARRTRRVVRENLAWAALYNGVCVPMALAGAMPPWLAGLGMAASSLLVVANSARLSRLRPESA